MHYLIISQGNGRYPCADSFIPVHCIASITDFFYPLLSSLDSLVHGMHHRILGSTAVVSELFHPCILITERATNDLEHCGRPLLSMP